MNHCQDCSRVHPKLRIGQKVRLRTKGTSIGHTNGLVAGRTYEVEEPDRYTEDLVRIKGVDIDSYYECDFDLIFEYDPMKDFDIS